ncbi:uncharacterized protein [Rutidosis leptorrhynchoides]|uniref:uncharacterized protein n=1 Tax=Rutidosis leptorrhynchoides TaxID=125765 RepID=UPI003A99F45A
MTDQNVMKKRNPHSIKNPTEALKLKSKNQKGILFKVDFEKAFDCLNWKFLEDVMSCMGFGNKWRKWILSCLESASISILVNGSPTNEFQLGIEVGNERVQVIHLQYADDTIFLGEWSRENARSLQNLLKCFEWASGLKVNFHKSYMYGIGVEQNDLATLANSFGCQMGCLPFKYLGLTIGSKMNKQTDWKPVVDKIKSRLSDWKMRTMRVFFWGGSGSDSKMSWVKWDRVISSYEGGGLNIGIYGPNGGLDLENDAIHSLKPSTWRNILLAGYEIEEKGVQFRNSLVKSVGNGRCTSFWEDVWLGGNKLLLFPRLYRLEQNQDARVADRILMYNDTWNANWQWQRNPSGRTCGELSSLSNLLNSFNFNCGNIDTWIWSMSSNGKFTVKSLASALDEVVLSGNNNYEETMRNNLIPKKLEIFVWRVTQKRLPVRIELDKRGIHLHTVRCPLCDDDLETVEHSLLFCNNAMEVWNRVYSSWGLGNMNNLSINEILRGKASSASMSCFGSKVWQAVEWVAAYFIWKNRNNMVFRGNK